MGESALVAGGLISIIGIVIGIVWLIMPFMIDSRLSKMNKQLKRLVEVTEAQADIQNRIATTIGFIRVPEEQQHETSQPS